MSILTTWGLKLHTVTEHIPQLLINCWLRTLWVAGSDSGWIPYVKAAKGI